MIMMPYGRCRSSLQLTGTHTSGTPQAALAILHVGHGQAQGGAAVQVTAAEAAGLIDRLRASGVTLTYDPDTRTIRTGDSGSIAVIVGRDR